MNRREFLKYALLASVASTIDFTGMRSLMAQGQASVASSPDMVAVMGGEPAAMLDRMLAEYGGIGTFVKKGMKVVLKPNIGWDRAPEMAANTNPALVGAMVRRCLGAGASEVLVFDHTCHDWVKSYQNSGIKAAVEAAGGKMVPGNDESYYVETALPQGVKLKSTKIHRSLRDCDVWFNMPVLKHHGGAKMTCSMKNYMGLVWDRQVFHSTDLQQCIADVTTYSKKPALHIVDAYRIMVQNGPQGKSENDVVSIKSLIASKDPVAADTAALNLYNQAKPITLASVSHIGQAEKLRLGTTKLDTLNIKRIKM